MWSQPLSVALVATHPATPARSPADHPRTPSPIGITFSAWHVQAVPATAPVTSACRNTLLLSSALSVRNASRVRIISVRTSARTQTSDHSSALSAGRRLRANTTGNATRGCTLGRRSLSVVGVSKLAEHGGAGGVLPGQMHSADISAARRDGFAFGRCWRRKRLNDSATRCSRRDRRLIPLWVSFRPILTRLACRWAATWIPCMVAWSSLAHFWNNTQRWQTWNGGVSRRTLTSLGMAAMPATAVASTRRAGGNGMMGA